jgi:hypothetical protein
MKQTPSAAHQQAGRIWTTIFFLFYSFRQVKTIQQSISIYRYDMTIFFAGCFIFFKGFFSFFQCLRHVAISLLAQRNGRKKGLLGGFPSQPPSPWQ